MTPTRTGHTYGQILRSSALMGGSSAVNILVGVARVKVMALLLGPAGVGLVGLYGSILDLAQSLTGMGLNSSGVRQVAAAVGTGDNLRVATTIAVLRRTAVVLGLVGAVLLVAFSRYISEWTFGSGAFMLPVAALSLAVLFRAISDAQGAMLQGLRRIRDMARIVVLTAICGTVTTITLVFFLRENGVAASLVVTAAISLTLSTWHRRKLDIAPVRLTASQTRVEAWDLLTLGGAFVASAVLTAGAAYAIRAIVRQQIGLDSAGLYQAAWNIGGLYVGFILQAMGSDFYPRLTSIASDHRECNRLVNEQTLVGLLLAGPGVIGTLTFAPLIITLFYSGSFHGAIEPLRWICLGMGLRVFAWPMGYIILAKNARWTFFLTEIAATAVHVGLAFVLVRWYGLRGSAMAFFGLYIWHGALVYGLVRRLTGFYWSDANRRTMLLFCPLIAIVFLAFVYLPTSHAMVLGTVCLLVATVYSVQMICSLVSVANLPPPVRRALFFLRLAPASGVQ